jgi:long-chain acyl-CoA synthetase
MTSEPRNLADIMGPGRPDEQPFIIEVAPCDSERSWSYGEARAHVQAIARGLLRMGLKRGDAVAILAENSAPYILAYLGIMWAGLAAVPINHRLPADTVAKLLDNCRSRLALVDDERRALVTGNVPVLDLEGAGEGSLQSICDAGEMAPVEMHDDEVATILYTSGSTGVPKGVELRHGGYVWVVRHYEHLRESMEGENVLVAAPLFHMNALAFSKVLMWLGGTNVLMRRFSPAGYIRAIDRHRCAAITSVPTMLAMVLREREALAHADLSCVRQVITGSSPSSDEFFRRLESVFPNAAVFNSWGTTEAGPVAFGPHPGGLPRPRVALGHPFPDVEVKLVGGPNDDEGVLWLRTPARMTGYIDRPEETAKSIKDGWYVTGDVMRRDENNFYYFVGRADDMIVCGGENVYPGEVEKLLERHPDVMQAAVVPVSDEIKHQLPVAFVVPRTGSAPSEQDIRDHALANGPAYAHPRAVWLVDALPLAGTNKIDRKALAERAGDLFAPRR